MADTKTPGVGERQTIELSKINPMIEKGDTDGHVRCVLGLLSFLFTEATDGSLTLSYADAHGMAMILDTCTAALAHAGSTATIESGATLASSGEVSID